MDARPIRSRPAVSRRGVLRLGILAASGIAYRRSARAAERVRIVGLLTGLALNDPLMSTKPSDDSRARLPGLIRDLARYGWVLGSNLRLEIRSSVGPAGARDKAAQELIDLRPDIILTNSSIETAAVMVRTRTIPIVFATSADPVGSGFVDSLARPGGNATGFTNSDAEVGGKWLQFLKEADPRLRRVGVFLNPATSPRQGRFFLDPLESAAGELGLSVKAVPIGDPSQIEAAVAACAGDPAVGIVVAVDSYLVGQRRPLVDAITRYRVPAIYPFRYFMDVGGLMSYGPALEVLAAEYINLILRGAKPGDLPVQSPRRYELLLNRKAAQALGLILPVSLLARADQIVE